jgi:hypothetical protein
VRDKPLQFLPLIEMNAARLRADDAGLNRCIKSGLAQHLVVVSKFQAMTVF